MGDETELGGRGFGTFALALDDEWRTAVTQDDEVCDADADGAGFVHATVDVGPFAATTFGDDLVVQVGFVADRFSIFIEASLWRATSFIGDEFSVGPAGHG